MQLMIDGENSLSSPTGPAEQPLGGSLDMSCNSYKQQFTMCINTTTTTNKQKWLKVITVLFTTQLANHHHHHLFTIIKYVI